jgi:hypothetical protein
VKIGIGHGIFRRVEKYQKRHLDKPENDFLSFEQPGNRVSFVAAKWR